MYGRRPLYDNEIRYHMWRMEVEIFLIASESRMSWVMEQIPKHRRVGLGIPIRFVSIQGNASDAGCCLQKSTSFLSRDPSSDV
jgi:hypothetical protein